MTFYILTLFPEMFEATFASSILKRAKDKKIIEIRMVNIRDFARDKHKTVDDKPYGGGKGMILKVDVLVNALETIKPKPYTILLSPSAKKYDQQKAIFFSRKKQLAIICGHYEGTDARLIPGVIHPESLKSESFSLISNFPFGSKLAQGEQFQISNLLEYPQYTRPENFRGLKIPKILLLGNHQQISNWRQKQAFKRTRKVRPDLIKIEKESKGSLE